MASKTGLPLRAAIAGLVLLATAACPAGEPAARTFGWRGNWTGLYGQADPPVEWSRAARGVMSGMTCQAARPGDGARQGAEAVKDGLVRDWLVLGPLGVADSAKDFDKEQVPGESALAPAEGDKAGELAWKQFRLAYKPDYERWGTTELDWIDLAEALDYEPNHVAYAHSYIHCPRAGRVRFVVEHTHGLKVWVNGQAAYAKAAHEGALSSYMGISRQKKALVHLRSPAFEVALREGWNRLLVKVGSYNQKGWRAMRFALRLLDAEPVAFEDKNILWVAKLPERTNAAPIVVGERIFTPAEPDELLCLDKKTGRILWRRFNALSDAATEAERAARGPQTRSVAFGEPSPALREKIDPLAAQRGQTTDYEKGLELRRQIRDALAAADPRKYDLKWDGHLEAHFGIVGFTTTPVSDGRSVWAFYGYGVAACYDLEGNRKWIRRLPCEEIRYSCSPAVIGGRLLVLFDGLHALDAATGEVAWSNPKVRSIASLVPARIAGTDVVFTRSGEVFRASDGKCLWANPHIRQGDTGWAAPLVLGEVMYLPWLGVGELIVADFTGVSGEEWKPQVRVISAGADHRRPNGEWLDRWTAASPLVLDGIYYNIDQYGVFYAVDLKTGQPLYKQDVGLDELHHYNAIGVAASPAMGGRHIYVLDNQGTCVVLQPGRQFRRVAVNRLESPLPRDWPIGPQEILSNGPPVFDGPCLYLRGEQHLFCIGRRGAAAPAEGKTP